MWVRCRYISRCCARSSAATSPPRPRLASYLHPSPYANSPALPDCATKPSAPHNPCSSTCDTHHQESNDESKETPANLRQLWPFLTRCARSRTHRIELKTSITRILTTAHSTRQYQPSHTSERGRTHKALHTKRHQLRSTLQTANQLTRIRRICQRRITPRDSHRHTAQEVARSHRQSTPEQGEARVVVRGGVQRLLRRGGAELGGEDDGCAGSVGVEKGREERTADDAVDADDLAEDDTAPRCEYGEERREHRTDLMRFFVRIRGARTPPPRMEEPVTQIPLSDRGRCRCQRCSPSLSP